MKTSHNVLNLIGRVLIAALFIPAGLSKLMAFEGTAGYFASLGMITPTLGVVVAVVVELLGGFALLVGYQTRIIAIIIAIFTFAATLIGHAYWAVPPEQAFVVKLMFFKNMAVIGGLLVLASSGAGKYSIDGIQASK